MSLPRFESVTMVLDSNDVAIVRLQILVKFDKLSPNKETGFSPLINNQLVLLIDCYDIYNEMDIS